MAQARVIWTDAALEDLLAITQFIAQDSPQNAAYLGDRVLESAQSLADFPMQGHRVHERIRPDRREITVYPYRIFYRVRGDRVDILSIWHGSRGNRPNLNDRERCADA